jgi:hypothetical protein
MVKGSEANSYRCPSVRYRDRVIRVGDTRTEAKSPFV